MRPDAVKRGRYTMKHFYYNKRTRFAQGAAALIAGAVLLGGSVLGGHGHLISLAADTSSQLPLKGEAIGALVIPEKLREEKPVHDKRLITKEAERVEIREENGPSQSAAPTALPEGASQGAAAKEEAAPWWTEEELELLACTIYCEAGSDCISDETRLMVGQVVINRVNSPDYPGTIEEVLTQRGQYGRFHWTGVVWPYRAGRSVETHAVERAYDCAERVLGGEWLLPTDVIYQAGFVQGREIVAQAPGFYFCR